jgi:hypothetical protein
VEATCEEFKFYIEIAEGSIKDLETEIINRQKRGIKLLSITELWAHVYSNFLLLLTQHLGSSLPKQKVLLHLEYPLSPLPTLNIDTIRQETKLLTQLLDDYHKFYQGHREAIEEGKQEQLLPAHVLLASTKFLYTAIEALIRQGIGTDHEVKQLQFELENVIK